MELRQQIGSMIYQNYHLYSALLNSGIALTNVVNVELMNMFERITKAVSYQSYLVIFLPRAH